ncbi:DNA polymerase IV [Ancylobacter dichloromethanicus]|uniref:DNA polymerase IV n=1 Tax=Ancylobacter dichloromethanicus TaxID=518825 RepID=A0A9W6J8H1_9HYPH|nr:DNA polymerase IV [Ancylobacter dichloromethanicus]MBS7554650.1 DNA polymerase IV [Ancylobacter dichloromethanicus]GLK71781.1 DNA polymerase IV [Ancylobacter dichloromethanicus]
MARLSAFCRDCLSEAGEERRCTRCGSPRLVRHAELDALHIAHIDCDAFYASVEKRDDPGLRDLPVIIGGGKRGVVSTACYLARVKGVRSAMPMFKALALCPEAVVIKPNMAKYVTVGRQIRERFLRLTPLVEPLSIDEAFLDLAGTALLHGESPARALARLARSVETEIGVTLSVGLAPNKFLAKMASELDKPRGFAVIGAREAMAFLAPRSVGAIWGVGKATQERLAREGYRIIADLQAVDESVLARRFGNEGLRLARLARGMDTRPVNPERETKSVSTETTFDTDIADFRTLEQELYRLTRKLSDRLKTADLAGRTVTLKLKTSDFRLVTRARSLEDPTRLAHRIFDHARELLARETDGRRFRLIGVGVSELTDPALADPADLVDAHATKRGLAELASDTLRARFGKEIIERGIALDAPRRRGPEQPHRNRPDDLDPLAPDPAISSTPPSAAPRRK